MVLLAAGRRGAAQARSPGVAAGGPGKGRAGLRVGPEGGRRWRGEELRVSAWKRDDPVSLVPFWRPCSQRSRLVVVGKGHAVVTTEGRRWA